MPTEITDNEKQQKAWFSQAVDDCMSSLYAMSMSLRLTNTSAEADDLVAEAVAKAWKSLHLLLQLDRFSSLDLRHTAQPLHQPIQKNHARPDTSCYDAVSDGYSDEEIATLFIEQSDGFLSWWANPDEALVNSLVGKEIVRALEVLRETVIPTTQGVMLLMLVDR